MLFKYLLCDSLKAINSILPRTDDQIFDLTILTEVALERKIRKCFYRDLRKNDGKCLWW